jgi:hypothetical protein
MRKDSTEVPNLRCYTESFCLSTSSGILGGKFQSINRWAALAPSVDGASGLSLTFLIQLLRTFVEIVCCFSSRSLLLMLKPQKTKNNQESLW